MDIKTLITNFITNVCEKNYSEANVGLQKIMEAKIKQKVATILEKKSSPAQKEARKKFLEKIKAKKKTSKKKGAKKVTEEGYEKKPFDKKGFRKLYAGEKSGPENISRSKKGSSRESSENEARIQDYNKRKDALKKSNKKGTN